jgi:hypothetical protein
LLKSRSAQQQRSRHSATKMPDGKSAAARHSTPALYTTPPQYSIMKIFFSTLAVLFCSIASAQNVGIGTTTPHASALLDVNSTNKGLLIPRINLASDSDVVTITTPRVALLVFNINNALPDGTGFYFWNGNKWSKFATSTNLSKLAWNVGGNSGTNAGVDFIGTTDNKPLVFRTNNILSGKIDPGPNNVFLGQSAGLSVTSATNNTFIGHAAGSNTLTGSNNVFLGHGAGELNSSGGANVFIGQDAGKNNQLGNSNVFVGEDAGLELTSGDENVYLGNGAGRTKIGSHNIAIGFSALAQGYQSAGYNIAIGHGAGKFAGNSYTLPAGGGIYIGTGAGLNATSGIAIGDSACRNCDPPYAYPNVAIGRMAMLNSGNGEGNVAIGPSALLSNTSGDYNVSVGNNALNANTTGDYNTAVGFNAGPQGFVPNLVNTTCLGNGARVTVSNTMSFGNGDVTDWAFGNNAVLVGAALQVGNDATNGNGAFLTQGGNWTNTCDINKKENFSVLNKPELLQKISLLNIQRWKYIGTNEYHIGPTAQEFYKAFNVGVDDKSISTVDPAGIALAAIQELIKENEMLKRELAEIRQLLKDKNR